MKRKDNLPWRKVDDEGIILSANKDEAHILNESAMIIWEMLDGRHSIDNIAEKLSQEYAISKKTALQDVNCFLKSLRTKELAE